MNRMRRISVVGNAGSGKTTLAVALAARLGVPHVELDAIYHQPGWTELPVEEFRGIVGRLVQEDAWVIDGNYSAVRDLVWERADTVVWLDLPRHMVMRQLARRTAARLLSRATLWNGNREPWRNVTSLDPNRSILAWSWTRHHLYRQRYEAAARDPAWSRLRFVPLTSRHDTRAFLATVAGPGPAGFASR
jgi:adenylate kinase family enzyme